VYIKIRDIKISENVMVLKVCEFYLLPVHYQCVKFKRFANDNKMSVNCVNFQTLAGASCGYDNITGPNQTVLLILPEDISRSE
jgi:hypothetical protein